MHDACVYARYIVGFIYVIQSYVYLLQAGWKIDMSVKLHRWESSENAMR